MKQLIILISLLHLLNYIEAMDTWHMRALYKQSPESHIQELKCVLQHQAKENDVEGMKSLFTIIEQSGYLNDVSTLKQLKLYAALFHAVNHGHYEATKYLLEKKLIHLQSNPNNLLHIVCYGKWHEDEKNTIDVINRMLELGANINKKDLQNRTPFDVACGRVNPYSLKYVDAAAPKSVQEFLIKRNAKKTETEVKPCPQVPSVASSGNRPHSDGGHPLYEPIRGNFFQERQKPDYYSGGDLLFDM